MTTISFIIEAHLSNLKQIKVSQPAVIIITLVGDIHVKRDFIIYSSQLPFHLHVDTIRPHAIELMAECLYHWNTCLFYRISINTIIRI